MRAKKLKFQQKTKQNLNLNLNYEIQTFVSIITLTCRTYSNRIQLLRSFGNFYSRFLL